MWNSESSEQSFISELDIPFGVLSKYMIKLQKQSMTCFLPFNAFLSGGKRFQEHQQKHTMTFDIETNPFILYKYTTSPFPVPDVSEDKQRREIDRFYTLQVSRAAAAPLNSVLSPTPKTKFDEWGALRFCVADLFQRTVDALIQSHVLSDATNLLLVSPFSNSTLAVICPEHSPYKVP